MGVPTSLAWPCRTLALAQSVAALPQLCLRGVMSIPEPTAGFDAQYALHLRAREVFDAIRASGFPGMAGLTPVHGHDDDLDAAIGGWQHHARGAWGFLNPGATAPAQEVR